MEGLSEKDTMAMSAKECRASLNGLPPKILRRLSSFLA